MTGHAAKWSVPWRGSVLLGTFVLVCAAISGCAGGPAGAPGAAALQAEPLTAFDEPDVRRRARIRLELASNYFEQGKTTVALDELKQAIAIDPTLADAYNLRGLIYMRLNDLAQAEDSFKRALALRGNDPDLLHNYGWLLCQRQRHAEAEQYFARALASPTYQDRAKTFMARGLCQSSAGQFAEAEEAFLKAYELDAGNPIVGYHLSSLLLRRNELTRAQFYIRRVNNGQFSTADSLWLGIKVERALGDSVAMKQLADQLRKRFPESRELGAFERGAFNE